MTILIDEFVVDNETLATNANCSHRVQVSSKKEKKCRCLHVLRKSVFFRCEAVGQYQLYFGRMKCEQQQKLMVELIRSSLFHFSGKQGPAHARGYAFLSFPIPFSLGGDDCVEMSISL
jgi:hypothetical protein